MLVRPTRAFRMRLIGLSCVNFVSLESAYSLDTEAVACCGQSRIGPCAGIALTHASAMRIVASIGIARKWTGSVHRWHLGQHRVDAHTLASPCGCGGYAALIFDHQNPFLSDHIWPNLVPGFSTYIAVQIFGATSVMQAPLAIVV